MQTETDATQGVPEGETVLAPANSSDSGTEATPQTESQVESSEAKDGEGEKPKQTPWFQRRIDDLTREKWEERRAREALQQRLVDLESRMPRPEADQDPNGQKTVTQADIDRMVTQRAQEIAAQQQQAEYRRQFDADANATYEKGKAEFPDFDEALGNFRLLGGLPPVLIEAALETGEGHKVLYNLGKNPDEAARILSLTPARQAVALAKMASAKPPPLSNAPSPVSPVSGQSRSGKRAEDMSINEWMKAREQGRI